MKKIDRNILLEAIVTWGIPSQLEKCSEECDELSAAIWNFLDHEDKGTRFDIADEVADVFITLSQVIEIIELDLSWGRVLDERIIFKLERLSMLIEKAKKEKEKAIAGS